MRLTKGYFHSPKSFGLCCTPTRIVGGFPSDFAFEVRGFVVGQPGEAYVRVIEPLRYSGRQGGVDELLASDDKYYILIGAPGFSLSRYHVASVRFETYLPKLPVTRLGLRVESGTDKALVEQTLSMLDYETAQWVVVDQRELPPMGDTVVKIDALPAPDRFISPDGRASLLLESYAPGLFIGPHQLRVDEVKWIVTYRQP